MIWLVIDVIDEQGSCWTVISECAFTVTLTGCAAGLLNTQMVWCMHSARKQIRTCRTRPSYAASLRSNSSCPSLGFAAGNADGHRWLVCGLQAYNDREHLETPYVAKLHRFTALAPTLPVFTFEHPNPAVEAAAGPDNARETPLRFERTGAPAAVCHGFAGYFDAQVPRVPAPLVEGLRAQAHMAPTRAPCDLMKALPHSHARQGVYLETLSLYPGLVDLLLGGDACWLQLP